MMVPAFSQPRELEGSWALFQMRRHDSIPETDWEMSLTLDGNGLARARVNTISYMHVQTAEGCMEMGRRGPARDLRGRYRVEGGHLIFSWQAPQDAPPQLFGSEPATQEWPFKLDTALRVTLPERWLLLVPSEQMPAPAPSI